MEKLEVKSFSHVEPKIYAYTLPAYHDHDGWVKIGYTEKKTAQERIHEQTHTARLSYHLDWDHIAMYTDGSHKYFKDGPFHRFLQFNKNIRRELSTEWFQVSPEQSEQYFYEFAAKRPVVSGSIEYKLRKEQEEAVSKTLDYFACGGEEFLWNAKPRFGKTLTSYELILRMNCTNVLIITNRPAVGNSWADDFFDFIYGKGIYDFVSDTDSIACRNGVKSREQYAEDVLAAPDGAEKKMIAFVSLQSLKGSTYFHGRIDKLEWLSDTYFDLVIVDESQEGVDTYKTYKALENLHKKHTLYLSGTPFKALASERFSSDQIFNWSYTDEQSAKQNWTEDALDTSQEDNASNPYEDLPGMEMYTYKMSDIIEAKVREGTDLGRGEETYD